MTSLHSSLWEHFISVREQGRLPHAILLTGPWHTEPHTLAERMATALLCKTRPEPCLNCQSCRLVSQKEHPDLYNIQPESANKNIKIEDIRQLFSVIYKYPQLGAARVVVINRAEKMNVASANALLKILEEPPDNTFFILVSEHISTLPATVISRCQKWCINPAPGLTGGYLQEAALYPSDSGRGKLFAEYEKITEQLQALQEKKISAVSLAQKWSVFEFTDLIWLLYLIHAEMINSAFLQKTKGVSPELPGGQPVFLFSRIDKLNYIIRNLNHNINRNELLMLENFLMEY